MSRSRLVLPAALVITLAVVAPAATQTPLEDPLDRRDAKRLDSMEKVVRELRSIVFKGRDSGAPVVVQPADTDARMAEMASRIGDLEQSLKSLNGTLETATRDLAQARRDNAALKTQLQGLTERLATAEQKLTEPVQAPQVAEAAPAPARGDAAGDFTKARQLMLAGDYDAAEAAFAAYVQVYPEAPKTAEASYWLGKTLTVRGAHSDAARAYIGAIKGWPQTSWAPDAVVELSRALVALKKPQDACQALVEFGKRYPKAPANVASRAAAVRGQAKCAA